jgi:TonB family protein
MNQVFLKTSFKAALVKNMLLVVALFTLALNANAQSAKKVAGPNQIYTAVEQSAQFPGGQNKFYQFLAQNLKYPAKARETDIQGRVFLTFVVEKDGTLSDVKVVKGLGSGLDEESVRVLKKSPRWIAGKQSGKKVRQQFTVPINFTLVKDDKKAAVHKSVTESGHFPGDNEAIYQYLAKTIHYPAKARENNIQGKVFISFVIEEDGELTDIKVLRGIGGGCDEEAVKAIAASPKWVPGKEDGIAVRQVFTMPISFTLAKKG